MDGLAQVAAYATADFDEPHQRLVDALVARFGDRLATGGDVRVLDLGCGPADVTVRLARALPTATVVGVDGANAMVVEGRARLEREGLTDRVELRLLRLPSADLGAEGWSLVVSTSVLHHLPDPDVLWSSVATTAGPGTAVFVGDLVRPGSAAAVDALVDREAAGEPEVLRADFRASLHAAYRVDEVAAQLAAAGLDGWLRAEPFGDRHLVVTGVRPG